MNFLPAKPSGIGKWSVAGQVFDGPKTDHSQLEFAIRPEDLQPAKAGLSAVAKVVEPLGAHLLVTCGIEGAQFRAVLDSDLTVKVGETLTLAPQPDRIRWFDPATTLAVA
jgi:multiple sugar transport system ATP-binding protein